MSPKKNPPPRERIDSISRKKKVHGQKAPHKTNFTGKTKKTLPMATARFQWTQTLETFIRQRLLDRSGEGNPKVLVNSQFLIDGIIMAINDHPLLFSESHVAVQNVIESCGKELRDGPRSAASAALSLYQAWSVYDAMCKQGIVAELHQIACSALPRLVSEHMPLFVPSGSNEASTLRQHEAYLEYNQLYWAMVRSWIHLNVFPQHVLDACSTALGQRIQHYQSEIQTGPSALDSSASMDNGSAGDEDAARGGVGAAVMTRLFEGLGGTTSGVAASGAGAISAVLNSFYSQGAARDAHACLECGALLQSAESLRDHRYFHRYLQAESNKHLRRLLAPSSDTFSRHGTNQSSGQFLKIACPQAEVPSNVDGARIQFK